jgi:hypothetical protein
MKTLLKIFGAMALSAGAGLGGADAAPGSFTDQPRLEILEPTSGGCTGRAAVCMSPGSKDTVLVPSSIAATPTSAGSVPRFTREHPTAGGGSGTSYEDSVPWTVQMSATLRQPAYSGNVVFVVYDRNDSKAAAHHEVAAVWQGPVVSGKKLAARLTLSPNDGFRPDHTYRIRVVQIIKGKEVRLADGDLHLM